MYITVLFIALNCVAGSFVYVNTSRGTVKGFEHDFGDDRSQLFFGKGQIFLGIPFAKPPIGERRFALPEDICNYNDNGQVHDATYYRPKCFQNQLTTEGMSEDCLFLNVMTPNVTGSYPVMVYIHGGIFAAGGAEEFHWKGALRNLVSRGVVVVTIQYRLSLFGFFTTYTDNFPPNRGMFDQLLALQWVQQEIGNFGGDNQRVTIFGQSAGATAVSNLYYSPLANGLIHNVIQTSGSALMQIETIDDPRGSIHEDRAEQICNLDPSNWGSAEKDQALLDCFNRASAKDLVKYDLTRFKNWNIATDGAFLPDFPENLAKTQPKIPVLMGDMLEEFATFALTTVAGNLSLFCADFNEKIIRDNWPYIDNATIHEISEIMINEYSNGSVPEAKDSLGWFKLHTAIHTGLTFTSSMIRDFKWRQESGNENLWIFTFNYRSLLPFSMKFFDWIPVSHGFEHAYLWFTPLNWQLKKYTPEDLQLAEIMGTLWTDFAKNGSLNYKRAGVEKNYFEINTEITEKSNWRETTDDVFNKKIPAVFEQIPTLKVKENSWITLNELGRRTQTQWRKNRNVCLRNIELKSESPDYLRLLLVLVLGSCLLIILLQQYLRKPRRAGYEKIAG